MEESSGLRTHVRPFESGRGVSSHHRPRVAQLRRAPLLQRGGWGFESLAADMPLKLSSAEQPPCKRKAVGSIPTWGSHPLVAQHGRGIRLRPGPVVVRIHAGGLTMRRRSIGRTAGCYPDDAGSTPAVAAPFLGRLNGRIFGSEPKDAWFESRPRSSILRTRTWRPCGLQHRRRGFDSFRPCSTRPGRLVGQDAGLSHR